MGVINGEMTKLDHRLMVIDTKYYVEVHQMGGAEGDLKLGGYRNTLLMKSLRHLERKQS